MFTEKIAEQQFVGKMQFVGATPYCCSYAVEKCDRFLKLTSRYTDTVTFEALGAFSLKVTELFLWISGETICFWISLRVKIIKADITTIFPYLCILLTAHSDYKTDKFMETRNVITGICLLLTVVIGKLFCGKVCPLVLLQDLLYKVPFSLKINKFKGEKVLLWLKYVFLLIIVVSPFLGISTETESDKLSIEQTIMWCTSLMVFIILYRPLCKYLCPYGAVASLFNLFSPYRYRIDRNKCIDCNKCAKICEMDIDIHRTPNHIECIRCGKCKKVCPTKAIKSAIVF